MVSISSLFRFLFIFTVITSALVGLLFDQLALVCLAAINGVLLLLISIIIRFAKGTMSIPHVKKETKSFVAEEETTQDDTVEEDAPVSSKSSHHTHHQQFVKYTYNHKKKKRGTSIIWLFALGAALLFYRFMNRPSVDVIPTDASLNSYSKNVLDQSDALSGAIASGVVVESTGEVLSTGLSTEASTGISVDKSFVTGTETNVSEETPTVTGKSTLKIANTQSVSLLEAVVYLLQTHNTALNLKKDLKFTGITTKNPYYKYWYTAYKMGLVGKTSSPSTLVSCQTYVVLKGMLEKWDVQYTSANVKTQYWAEAEKRDALNGCVFGKTLKGANLN